MQAAGIEHYQNTCRLCYGAPGIPRNEFAEGLYPGAPNLNNDDLHRKLNVVKLFWIIKNGPKLTGMPAFGVTHKDREIRDIAAFVDRLPDLKPDRYKAMIKAANQGDGHHDESGEEAGHGEEAQHH